MNSEKLLLMLCIALRRSPEHTVDALHYLWGLDPEKMSDEMKECLKANPDLKDIVFGVKKS